MIHGEWPCCQAVARSTVQSQMTASELCRGPGVAQVAWQQRTWAGTAQSLLNRGSAPVTASYSETFRLACSRVCCKQTQLEMLQAAVLPRAMAPGSCRAIFMSRVPLEWTCNPNGHVSQTYSAIHRTQSTSAGHSPKHRHQLCQQQDTTTHDVPACTWQLEILHVGAAGAEAGALTTQAARFTSGRRQIRLRRQREKCPNTPPLLGSGRCGQA